MRCSRPSLIEHQGNGAHRPQAAIKIGWNKIDVILADGMAEIDRHPWENANAEGCVKTPSDPVFRANRPDP
jgi:hypothetical protein